MKGCLKGVVGFILIIILLGACVAVFSGDDEKEESTATESNDNKSEAKEKPEKKEKAEKPKEKIYKIGDTVKVGDMVYKVKSITTAKEVGPTYGKVNAKDTFVVVDVVVQNNGNEAVTVDASFFTLLKGDKKFEADSSASMSANQSENGDIDNSFFLESINPESKLEGKVVFDVSAATATSTGLELQVQTGFWGTETEVIKLK